MSERKIVRRMLEDLDLESLMNGTPSEVISRIKQIEDNYKGRDIYFYVESYYNSTQLQLNERRLETDKEYADRLKIERKEQLSKKKEERRVYETLKKKFEGKDE